MYGYSPESPGCTRAASASATSGGAGPASSPRNSARRPGRRGNPMTASERPAITRITPTNRPRASSTAPTQGNA